MVNELKTEVKKEPKLVKCFVLKSNLNWNHGDFVMVPQDDIRIKNGEVKEVK